MIGTRNIMKNKTCFLSIDVEEDLRADGQKSFRGAENLEEMLAIFKQFEAPATLFVTGEALANYPELAKNWAVDFEIGCHGYWHRPLSQLPLAEREKGLVDFLGLKEVKGFRAVQNVIDNEQFPLLEKYGFLYDSSVVPNYPFLKKYIGYKGRAPLAPYHPAVGNHLEKGEMKILEIPLTPHLWGIPLVGTWLRKLGVGFYKILFFFYQPKFISFSMHSWDPILSDNYLKQLAEMLAFLKKKNYHFLNSYEISRNQ